MEMKINNKKEMDCSKKAQKEAFKTLQSVLDKKAVRDDIAFILSQAYGGK